MLNRRHAGNRVESTILYNNAIDLLRAGTLDWENDDVRVMLVTLAYTPDPDDQFVSAVVAAEIASVNYARKKLIHRAIIDAELDGLYSLDGGDVVWASLGAGLPARAVIFRQVTNDSDSTLIACVDIIAPMPTGLDYPVIWDQAGIVTVVRA